MQYAYLHENSHNIVVGDPTIKARCVVAKKLSIGRIRSLEYDVFATNANLTLVTF